MLSGRFVSHAARMRRRASLRRQRGRPLAAFRYGAALAGVSLRLQSGARHGEKASAQPNASLAVLIEASKKPLTLAYSTDILH
jgi:hypothetical protein